MNEYLEKFNELQEQNTFRGQQWFGKRQDLVEEYAWAVPNEDVLVYLSEFNELIEIGAGNGYWASLLDERGCDVRAIDQIPPKETYHDVQEMNVKQFGAEIVDSVVLMVWPPYDTDMSYTVLSYEPSHVLYVGESRGGCTGSTSFFNRLEKEYGLVATIDLPSYAGVHDDFYHYVRKV